MHFEEVRDDLLRIRSSKGIHNLPSRLVWISISKGNPVPDGRKRANSGSADRTDETQPLADCWRQVSEISTTKEPMAHLWIGRHRDHENCDGLVGSAG